jgi:lauroyl/myristoyl acyltransferase
LFSRLALVYPSTPIVPGFIHTDQGGFILIAAEGSLEPDLRKSTRRWMSSFERRFREHPADWVFMLDKRWARVLAAAAKQA